VARMAGWATALLGPCGVSIGTVFGQHAVGPRAPLGNFRIGVNGQPWCCPARPNRNRIGGKDREERVGRSAAQQPVPANGASSNSANVG